MQHRITSACGLLLLVLAVMVLVLTGQHHEGRKRGFNVSDERR
jgi:hypothetical protein